MAMSKVTTWDATNGTVRPKTIPGGRGRLTLQGAMAKQSSLSVSLPYMVR